MYLKDTQSLQTLHKHTHTPVQSDGRHGVDAGEYGCDGEEVVEAAVNQTEVPLVVNRVGKVDHRVECRHAGFCKGQVHLQERESVTHTRS